MDEPKAGEQEYVAYDGNDHVAAGYINCWTISYSIEH
jgi:hypothetical protein